MGDAKRRPSAGQAGAKRLNFFFGHTMFWVGHPKLGWSLANMALPKIYAFFYPVTSKMKIKSIYSIYFNLSQNLKNRNVKNCNQAVKKCLPIDKLGHISTIPTPVAKKALWIWCGEKKIARSPKKIRVCTQKFDFDTLICKAMELQTLWPPLATPFTLATPGHSLGPTSKNMEWYMAIAALCVLPSMHGPWLNQPN